MQSRDATTPRRSFIAAVREVKKAHGVHLSQTLTPQKNRAFVDDVLRRPEALAYLTRHASHVLFAHNVPQLAAPVDRAGKNVSDYHEMQLHRMLGKTGRVPFRGEVNKAFTTQGATPYEFDLLLGELANDAMHLRQVVTRPLHFKDLRPVVTALSCTTEPKAKDMCFALTPVWEKGHATAMLTIFEPRRRTPLASVFINSIPDGKRYAAALHDYQHAQPGAPRLPLVDASHALQLSRSDFSCTIYSYNMLRAMHVMLATGETGERVLRLAREANRGDQFAELALRFVFTMNIKKYLRQYYEVDGSVRPQAELDAYNAQARWNLGARSIALLAQASCPGASPASPAV